MSANGELRFNYDQAIAGRDGEIDCDNCVIRGASLIKSGPAEGHGLVVDDTLLKQLQVCGKEKGKVAVNLDHGSGVTSTIGYVTAFRIDNNKLRGDVHLLKEHKETPILLERAQRMPECFGLSVAFRPPDGNKKGDPIGNGQFAARCDKLMSVDIVTRPAANESLFSEPPVDKSKNGMAKEKGTDPAAGAQGADPSLTDVLAAIEQLSSRLDQQDQFNQQITEHLNAGNEPSLQDLVDATDEDLAAVGLTREDVNAAVAEVTSGMEGPEGEGQPQGQSQGQAVETAGVTAGIAGEAVGGTTGAANFAALQKEVIALKNKQKVTELQAKKEAETIELAEIEKKIMTLASQRDEAIKLNESLKAENDALRLAVKTGTRPVKAGVDTGLRMFSANDNGELHEFQVRVKQLTDGGKTQGEAIMLAQKENPGLHADWVQGQRKRPVAA